MPRLLALAVDLLRDRRGGTAIEYCFIAALIAMAVFGMVGQIGAALIPKFSGVLPGLR